MTLYAERQTWRAGGKSMTYPRCCWLVTAWQFHVVVMNTPGSLAVRRWPGVTVRTTAGRIFFWVNAQYDGWRRGGRGAVNAGGLPVRPSIRNGCKRDDILLATLTWWTLNGLSRAPVHYAAEPSAGTIVVPWRDIVHVMATTWLAGVYDCGIIDKRLTATGLLLPAFAVMCNPRCTNPVATFRLFGTARRAATPLP